MRLPVAIVSSLLVLSSSLAWAVTPVTTCGQTVQGVGELVGDLDCSSGERGSVETNGNKPFLLFLHTFQVHDPDLMPTILSLTGIPKPSQAGGANILA